MQDVHVLQHSQEQVKNLTPVLKYKKRPSKFQFKTFNSPRTANKFGTNNIQRKLAETHNGFVHQSPASNKNAKIRINPNGTVTEFNPQGKQVAPLAPTPVRMVRPDGTQIRDLINEEYLNLLTNGELLDHKTFVSHNQKAARVSRTPLRVADAQTSTIFKDVLVKSPQVRSPAATFQTTAQTSLSTRLAQNWDVGSRRLTPGQTMALGKSSLMHTTGNFRTPKHALGHQREGILLETMNIIAEHKPEASKPEEREQATEPESPTRQLQSVEISKVYATQQSPEETAIEDEEEVPR